MKKLLRCYSQVLSNYPFGIMLAITSISITALVLSVTLQDLPDFSDPQAGFLTRGTEIARRLTAYENLLDSVSHIGPLTTNPLEARSLANKGGKNKGGKRKRRKKNRNGTKQGDGPYKKRNGGKRHRANSKDDLSLRESGECKYSRSEHVFFKKAAETGISRAPVGSSWLSWGVSALSAICQCLEGSLFSLLGKWTFKKGNKSFLATLNLVVDAVDSIKNQEGWPSILVWTVNKGLVQDAQNINAPRVLPSEEEQLSMDLDPSVPRYGIQREDQRPLNVGRAYVRNKRNIVEPQAILSSSQHRDIGWMCGEPMADYAHVVFKSNR
eukprot:TCALIF_06912-PA protein Name:"Similar to disp Protein dispatched (Drosophila melanogaster)" AED:0.12 eAED:0.12 QI:365/0.5/0.6/0.8/0.75/0.8/5/0/324